MDIQNQMHCRLCDKDITGKNGLLLYDYNENVETQLGRKISIILNTSDTCENLSNYCCEFCSSKIEICFSLLVEIQASDEVIRQTYTNLANGKKINTATQLYTCGDCRTTVSGIKSFIKHYENHLLKKTTVGSKKDVELSSIKKYDELNVKNNVKVLYNKNLSDSSNEVQLIKDEEVNSDCIKNDESDFVNNALSEEVESSYNIINIDPSSHEYLSENSVPTGDVSLDEIGSLNEFMEESDDDALSDSSLVSDSSYNNLVETVKKELEETDEEDNHILPNDEGTYTCKICELSFEYKFILKLHLRNDHKDYHELDVSYIKELMRNIDEEYNGDTECCYCKESFSASELANHLIVCGEQYSQNKSILCQICGKMCTFKSLEKHMEQHKNLDGWACEHCDKKFKNKRFLKSHLGEHDESKKKMCEFCGQKFLPLSFFSHVMKHREKRHVCQHCGKAFSYNYGLRIHLKTHDTKKSEPKPEKKRDKVFCWLCKKDFDCTIALNKHLKNDHNACGVEQDSRFSCSQCDKKFADMFSLKAHLKLIHEMKDEEIARLKSLPVYRYIECNVCNKVFNSENKIRIHMKQDHGLKPYEMEILKKECEKCGKKFASKQNLIHHINGAHLHIKPMTCDICQEKFAKHSSLIYHKLRHSGEKPFQCEYCQKSYRQRNDVIRHLARHVRDKELTLEEASAVNNSPSRLVMKRRIFLKDSSINYQTIVRKNRRKSEVVEMEPILEEEINEIQEEQMDFNEDGISESMIYVEEIPVEDNQPESPSDVHYINAKPVYNEERNTIILSSPEVVKNSVKNVTYRYIPSQLKHMPAVIVKKQEQI